MTRQSNRSLQAFTLIELLVVIAIIAILAAILFPVFAAVREQARQSNTMTSLHSVYVGVKMFDDDEGHFPYVLYPYAETVINPAEPAPPYNRPMMTTSDGPVVPFPFATGYFSTVTANVPERGFVYPEQIKDSLPYTNDDNLQKTDKSVTTVFWPINSPISIALGGTAANPIPVTWLQAGNTGACPASGDKDIPLPVGTTLNYVGATKVYYLKDSMDIGPMLNTDGSINYVPGSNPPTPRYELHYSPDWSYLYGTGCDVNGSNQPYVEQLKYQSPPSDRTVITYVTQHVATVGSSKVEVLTLDGHVRKIDAKIAGSQFPVSYAP